MKQRPVIRLARIGDLHAIVMGLYKLGEETFWKTTGVPLRYGHLEATILDLLSRPTAQCWVVEDDGTVVGFCGAEVLTARFVPDVPVVQEWGCWLEPAYRHTWVGPRLWRTVKEWGARQGARGALRGKLTRRGETTQWEAIHA